MLQTLMNMFFLYKKAAMDQGGHLEDCQPKGDAVSRRDSPRSSLRR